MFTSYTSYASNTIPNTKVSDPVTLTPSQSSTILKKSLKGEQKFKDIDPDHCEQHNIISEEKYPQHIESIFDMDTTVLHDAASILENTKTVRNAFSIPPRPPKTQVTKPSSPYPFY